MTMNIYLWDRRADQSKWQLCNLGYLIATMITLGFGHFTDCVCGNFARRTSGRVLRSLERHAITAQPDAPDSHASTSMTYLPPRVLCLRFSQKKETYDHAVSPSLQYVLHFKNGGFKLNCFFIGAPARFLTTLGNFAGKSSRRPGACARLHV